jgi:hypothetical protein
MNETNNQFSLDMDSEKMAFSPFLDMPKINEENYTISFDPISFESMSSQDIQQAESSLYSVNNELVRPMEGIIPAAAIQSHRIETAESYQKNLTNQKSDQVEIYKKMNTLSFAIDTISKQVSQKANVVTNSAPLTDQKILISQKNIMFFDRLNRISKRPYWA